MLIGYSIAVFQLCNVSKSTYKRISFVLILKCEQNEEFLRLESCELFECDVYMKEICDLICLAQAGKNIIYFENITFFIFNALKNL